MSAFVSFDERIKGRIGPGFLADFVVLEKDPMECPPGEIAGIKVLETWMNGKIRYRSE